MFIERTDFWFKNFANTNCNFILFGKKKEERKRNEKTINYKPRR